MAIKLKRKVDIVGGVEVRAYEKVRLGVPELTATAPTCAFLARLSSRTEACKGEARILGVQLQCDL